MYGLDIEKELVQDVVDAIHKEFNIVPVKTYWDSDLEDKNTQGDLVHQKKKRKAKVASARQTGKKVIRKYGRRDSKRDR
jgi:hypothetical protein